MTNPLPPEPTPPQHRRRDDEWVAVLVAFGAIAAILFGVLGRRGSDGGFKGWSALFAPATAPAPVQSPSPFIQPTPVATVQPLLPRLLGRETQPVPTETQAVQPTLVLPQAVAPARVASVPARTGLQFKDVPDNYWARDAITALAERQIIAGFTDGTFRPDRPITRAEFASIVSNFLPDRARRTPIDFKDIPSDYWAAEEVDRAVKQGFMKGYPGQTFRPAQQIPRLEALVALSAGLNLQPPPNPAAVLQQYPDRDKIPAWATNSIASASTAGLAVNAPNQGQLLQPQRPATRADVAAMIYRALERTE